MTHPARTSESKGPTIVLSLKGPSRSSVLPPVSRNTVRGCTKPASLPPPGSATVPAEAAQCSFKWSVITVAKIQDPYHTVVVREQEGHFVAAHLYPTERNKTSVPEDLPLMLHVENPSVGRGEVPATVELFEKGRVVLRNMTGSVTTSALEHATADALPLVAASMLPPDTSFGVFTTAPNNSCRHPASRAEKSQPVLPEGRSRVLAATSDSNHLTCSVKKKGPEGVKADRHRHCCPRVSTDPFTLVTPEVPQTTAAAIATTWCPVLH